ncbi:hypothetical protein [Arvimicrobium flavum]|uniref:hypothetical protein n=1 Tax=Arvimicrobium flavum TaxID=3393320 RepID=UPI00237AFB25|nr:hypothetical protein [Mesorhizobium shangrilense]
MADSGSARSVSGEMMTAGGATARGADALSDVIDADYVEIVPEPRMPTPREAVGAISSFNSTGMAVLERGAAAASPSAGARGGPVFWVAGAIAVCAAFWISGGHALVRENLSPATQDISPKLLIGDVRSRSETVEGTPALLVDGEVLNEGRASGEMPSLAIRVTSMDSGVTTYLLGTSRQPLAPGAKYRFSSRLDMPKDGVKTVTVAFDE